MRSGDAGLMKKSCASHDVQVESFGLDQIVGNISRDGKKWTSIKTELLSDDRLKLTIHMEGEKLFVASLEPYRVSDLQKLIAEIKGNPLVDINIIGNLNLLSSTSVLTLFNKWFIYYGSANGVSNSLNFNHVDSGINSYW